MTVVRHPELKRIREIVCEIRAAQVDGEIVRIVDLEPVIRVVVRRVQVEAGISRHPFVDVNHQRCRRAVVGASGRDVIQRLPVEELSIRAGTVAAVRIDAFVVQIIHDLRGATDHARQRDGARASVQTEVRVPFRRRALAGFAIREDRFELARIEHRTSGEGPLGKIRVA